LTTDSPTHADVTSSALRRAHALIAGSAARANLAYTAALAGLTGVVLACYSVARPPLFNPGTSVDPWLYTAAFRNLGYVYQHFGTTYYVSRLPWVIPGRIAYALFAPATAYYVLHVVFAIGGALFLSLLVRRYFGAPVALVAYAVMIASPLYYNAHYWDYVDGPELTYLLAAMYFALSRQRGRLRLPYAVLAGFCAFASITTQLYATFFIAALVLAYVVLEVSRDVDLRGVVVDVAGFAAGVFLLVCVCGVFSLAHGERFLFFMPQIHALAQINPTKYRNASYDWGREPRILVPLFALVLLGALWPGRRLVRPGSPERFAVAAAAFLASTYALMVVWEFFLNGTPLELPDRFVQLDSGIVLCLAAAVYFAFERARLTAVARYVVAALLAAISLVPLLVIYGRSDFSFVSTRGLKIGVGAAAAALAVALIARLPSRRLGVLAAAAAAALVFAANWSFAASHEVKSWFNESGTVFIIRPGAHGPSGIVESKRLEISSHRANRATFDLGMQLIGYLERTGVQRDDPVFWYDLQQLPFAQGVQSLYYYSYTYVGVDMPKASADFKFRMNLFKPKTIVLLCRLRPCEGALGTLKRIGFRVQSASAKLLNASPEQMWVRIVRRSGP
jgi:hypothetical protein